MSQESKNLKICCFATILAGISSVVMGVANLVGTEGPLDALLAVAAGAVGILLGLWGARAANVPTNAAHIMRISLVAGLICLVAVVVAGLAGAGYAGNTGAVTACGLPAAGAVGIRVTSRRVEKTLD